MFQRIKYVGLLALFCPVLAYAQSLGDSAQSLYEGPVSMLALMMVWVCYVVGAAFCIGAVMQLRIHFQNPKVVPLLTPVVMIVAGVALILLPYFSEMDSNTANPILSNPKGAYRPSVPYLNPSEESMAEPIQNDGVGHWTDDPRYR